jgi:biopolymer transport protein ExbD
MRIRPTRDDLGNAEGDMTPMIDMTFQLIAFFMVIINFSEAEVSEAVQLPASQLAQPPEIPPEHLLTLQLTADGHVILGGQSMTMEQIGGALSRERQLFQLSNTSLAEVTVVVRADRRAKTGVVQELISKCQDTGFERYALRAEQATAD